VTGDPSQSTVKIALICGDMVACQARSDDRALRLWDLVGGVCDADEAPVDCALSHIWQVFGLRIAHTRILGPHSYQHASKPGDRSHFMAVILTMDERAAVAQAGPDWGMMPIAQFINHPHADRQLQHRLAEFIST